MKNQPPTFGNFSKMLALFYLSPPFFHLSPILFYLTPPLCYLPPHLCVYSSRRPFFDCHRFLFLDTVFYVHIVTTPFFYLFPLFFYLSLPLCYLLSLTTFLLVAASFFTCHCSFLPIWPFCDRSDFFICRRTFF